LKIRGGILIDFDILCMIEIEHVIWKSRWGISDRLCRIEIEFVIFEKWEREFLMDYTRSKICNVKIGEGEILILTLTCL
jgi:hypothetical protein